MFFPEEVIEEIQQRADIVEVISHYLPLKKTGNLFKALCPFHQEKTPSFMVNPQKQIFHCFGCGVGGNVFTFLMKQENISFPEAVEILAKQTGVDISHLVTGNINKGSSEITPKLYELNELATAYYQNFLNREEGKGAREYLKKRKISSELISKFRIGYAPFRNRLLTYLQKRGYKQELLIKAGLIIKREDGRELDRFINKLIFPLFNPQGRIVGFGSRRLDNQVPKYVNSPQTVLFNKSRYLYGLNFARHFIKKDVIVVEGYLDLLALVQFGIYNAVACLGTALTRQQIRVLQRYAERCIIIYDGDRAGQEASVRELELFIEEDVPVGVVELPRGLDPDECIRKEGKERFIQRIEKADDFFDYKLNFLSQRYDLEKAEDLAKVSKEMISSLYKIGDAVLRDAYIKRLSRKLNIREDSLYLEIEKLDALDRKRQRKKNVSFKASVPTQYREEKILLGLMLTEEEVISLVRKSLKPDEFRNLSIGKIVRFLLSKERRIPLSQLIEKLRKEEIEGLDSLISSCVNQLEESLDLNKKISIASDCIKRIKRKKREAKLLDLQKRIESAEEKEDETLSSQLLEEYQRVLNTDGTDI
ncbi:MAG: DNA primase [Candidatus Omnitrophica bacterium 4484_213]|nr:MAG: DNA primase [Candidatus Omnitrophica bacterium 4484_213]